MLDPLVAHLVHDLVVGVNAIEAIEVVPIYEGFVGVHSILEVAGIEKLLALSNCLLSRYAKALLEEIHSIRANEGVLVGVQMPLAVGDDDVLLKLVAESATGLFFDIPLAVRLGTFSSSNQ
jgi:hypothetical protein